MKRLALLLALTITATAQQRGWVGLYLTSLDPNNASRYSVTPEAADQTVLVSEVVPNSPGERSGLRAGDLITTVDGHPVHSPDEAGNALARHHPGTKARVGIVHPMPNGRSTSLEIMVDIGAAPAQPAPQNTNEGAGYSYSTDGTIQVIPANSTAPQDNHPYPRNSTQPRPISDDQQAQLVREGACQALLPQGWQLQPGPNGQSADVTGPNGAHVGWGILAVNPAMRRFYGNLYGPPEDHVATMVQGLLHTQPRFLTTQDIGGFYTAHTFQAGNVTGAILYHAFPQRGFGIPSGQYIITEYFAWAPTGDDRNLSQAQAIMTTLSCRSSVRPPPSDSEIVHANPNGVPSSHRNAAARESAESSSLKGYNSQLGTQYAHDSAGRNYYLDRATQWNDTGRDGPGYYSRTGEKLELGIQ